jgi:hypothetical protein
MFLPVLGKLVYELPLILFVLYLGPQDGAHPARLRRAGEYATRLKTLDVFTVSLGDARVRSVWRSASLVTARGQPGI